ENIGCRPCHVVGDDQPTRNFRLKEGNNYGPELNRVGDKVNPQWLFDWLKDPKRFRPKSHMPNMRLTDQEAMDMVAYLMTLNTSSAIRESVDFSWLEDLDSEEKITQGANAIRSYGCFGCHDIKGMENEKKVSVELSDFADKEAEELFFGDAIAEGKVGGETWDDWVIGKLKNSWIYATEMVEQKMPNFGFSEENASILMMLLKSFNKISISEEYTEKLKPDEIAIEEGKILLQRNNCLSCHIVEGHGGDVESQIVKTFMGEGKTEEEARAFAPPSLEGEGAKVQPDWLYRFLKNPVTLRPWLRVRMPTYYFSDEEAIIMERYFSKVAKQEFKYEYVEDRKIPKDMLQAAKLLYSKDYFDCFSCHQIGDKKPEGDPSGWAPDLTVAWQRLKPEWIENWIRDPQAIQPGTKMPSYYPDSYPDDILGGDPEKQIRAMKDYLMSLRKEERY
ncbi:MAG: c-type cytochrome, partial [Candidatus Aerophobetes bacterium]